MKKLVFVLNFLCSLMLISCGSSDEFRIAGTIEGLGTQNLWLYYYTNDAMHEQSTILLDGKFSVVGYADEPTVVELYSTDKVLLGRIMVENGQTVECVLDKSNRYNVTYSGNEVSARWGKFLKDNSQTLSSGDVSKINKVIEEYIVSHSEDMLSTMLLLTEYWAIDNELMADSLLNTIAPQARPRSLVAAYESMLQEVNSEQARGKVKMINLFSKGDTIYVFNPLVASYSVMVFSEAQDAMRDSLVETMRRLTDGKREKKLNVVDIAFANDTIQWKKSIKEDEADWVQCWALGGVEAKGVDRLAIPRTPYIVVVDSTGTQLYRGSSMSKASALIDSVNAKKE